MTVRRRREIPRPRESPVILHIQNNVAYESLSTWSKEKYETRQISCPFLSLRSFTRVQSSIIHVWITLDLSTLHLATCCPFSSIRNRPTPKATTQSEEMTGPYLSTYTKSAVQHKHGDFPFYTLTRASPFPRNIAHIHEILRICCTRDNNTRSDFRTSARPACTAKAQGLLHDIHTCPT